MATTAPTETAPTLDDYLAIAKRRFWHSMIVFALVLAIAVFVINSLPPRYRSTAIISVESQQIREELVLSTVTGQANERIEFVRQRVMTNARLLELIDKLDLFPRERGTTPDSVLVAKLRQQIFLEPIEDESGTSRGRNPTVAFALSVEDRDPEIAAAIDKDLVSMFLEENVKTRTAQATETTEFLAREAARLSKQVAATDAKVAEFKEKHSDTLPDHLDLRINMLQTAAADLNSVKQQETALQERRGYLEAQRASVRTILSAGTSANRSLLSPAQLLAGLRAELAEKSSVYGSSHPDIRSLKRKIASLEKAVGKDSSAAPAVDPASVQIEAQIVSATAQLNSLQEQKVDLQQKIKTLQAQIIETPQVERKLKDLTRGYESAMSEFDNIKSKQREAELAESLETQQKAERFILLEPPQVPSVPVWPKKPKVYVFALIIAVGSGAGTALLAEFLDKSIRGPAALTSILQRHPLAVIPFIERSSDRRREQAHKVRLWLVLLFFLVVALAITHFFYQPLDILFSSLLEGGTPP